MDLIPQVSGSDAFADARRRLQKYRHPNIATSSTLTANICTTVACTSPVRSRAEYTCETALPHGDKEDVFETPRATLSRSDLLTHITSARGFVDLPYDSRDSHSGSSVAARKSQESSNFSIFQDEESSEQTCRRDAVSVVGDIPGRHAASSAARSTRGKGSPRQRHLLGSTTTTTTTTPSMDVDLVEAIPSSSLCFPEPPSWLSTAESRGSTLLEETQIPVNCYVCL